MENEIFSNYSLSISSILGLNNISMPDGTVRKVVAKKTVDNCVDNLLKKEWKTICHYSLREKQPVILQKNKSFPPFFAEKRYKLCKFAPSKQIVDKVTMCFIISR